MIIIRTYNGETPHNADRRVARHRRAEKRRWILSGVTGGLMAFGVWVVLWLVVAVDLGIL
jgi:hypothetical protein